MIRYLVVLAGLLSPGYVLAQGNSTERKYISTPWHLVDTWWDLGKEMPFESYSVDVTLSDTVNPKIPLYIAPIGLGHLNKIPFYGGIQTQLDGNTKKDTRLRKLGPGFLFSMWEERRLEAIRPADGGFCQSSGHEGDFVSVRRPYEWTKGKYTYRLTKMDKEMVDGQPATWVGAFVYSHEKDENIFVGALRFKGENLVLDRKVANFVEIYGRVIPTTDIPHVQITFGNLKVNGEKVLNPTARAIYPKGVPDFAEATTVGQSLQVTLGTEVTNREKRDIKLQFKD
ncbi:hypothetical protein KIH39_25465 [Telmatocola sphagniphila]|uniref:Uncharacterized protein n=1 Tax=Telmatocola sphagniphila TaxID=1123043 RepID=A0A8E6B4T4_9BACT|nr:hypothetical protein [Telmatocola sphagniphila]QVL32145.1 hypothetical protein KIH39_25465 [Telmatocola sphagniphila]